VRFWSKGRTKKKVAKERDRGKVGFLETNVVILKNAQPTL